MQSLNKVFIMGYVGKDPETKYLPNGTALSTFSVATTEKQKDKEPKTEWHNVVAFGRLAEVVEKYVTKGSPVLIVGRLRYREWEDKEGNKKRVAEVLANELKLLASKEKEGSSGSEGIDDDSIPF